MDDVSRLISYLFIQLSDVFVFPHVLLWRNVDKMLIVKSCTRKFKQMQASKYNPILNVILMTFNDISIIDSRFVKKSPENLTTPLDFPLIIKHVSLIISDDVLILKIMCRSISSFRKNIRRAEADSNYFFPSQCACRVKVTGQKVLGKWESRDKTKR